MNTLLDTIHISEWFEQTKDCPVIISGPCSAETEEQVINTAKQISLIDKVNRLSINNKPWIVSCKELKFGDSQLNQIRGILCFKQINYKPIKF